MPPQGMGVVPQDHDDHPTTSHGEMLAPSTLVGFRYTPASYLHRMEQKHHHQQQKQPAATATAPSMGPKMPPVRLEHRPWRSGSAEEEVNDVYTQQTRYKAIRKETTITDHFAKRVEQKKEEYRARIRRDSANSTTCAAAAASTVTATACGTTACGGPTMIEDEEEWNGGDAASVDDQSLDSTLGVTKNIDSYFETSLVAARQTSFAKQLANQQTHVQPNNSYAHQQAAALQKEKNDAVTIRNMRAHRMRGSLKATAEEQEAIEELRRKRAMQEARLEEERQRIRQMEQDRIEQERLQVEKEQKYLKDMELAREKAAQARRLREEETARREEAARLRALELEHEAVMLRSYSPANTAPHVVTPEPSRKKPTSSRRHRRRHSDPLPHLDFLDDIHDFLREMGVCKTCAACFGEDVVDMVDDDSATLDVEETKTSPRQKKRREGRHGKKSDDGSHASF